MESPQEIKKQFGITISTANFIYESGEIPSVDLFPEDTPLDDLVAIAMQLEDLDEFDAELMIRTRLGMQLYSPNILEVIEVD
jgi:hypothetical protein